MLPSHLLPFLEVRTFNLMEIISWYINAITFIKVYRRSRSKFIKWPLLRVACERIVEEEINWWHVLLFEGSDRRSILFLVVSWYIEPFSCVNFLSIYMWHQNHLGRAINGAHNLLNLVVMRLILKSLSLDNHYFLNWTNIRHESWRIYHCG